jgi:CheY-like chemotaxis protein
VIDLRDNVRASVEAIRFDVDRKGIAVSLRLPEAPVYVHGDPERLQQVIVNLLTNAVKFTPASGRVEVDLQTLRGHAHLHVTDDGEGIDPSFLPFVFERFRQDTTSNTRTNKGLGLGLAIVKQLVEAHDGAVAAHSDGKGLGARFTVSLPITEETAHRQTPAPASDPLPSLDAVRVLLVDDEPETVEVMRTILHSAGATVGTATTVTHALDLAASFEPHVVVTDIAMPGEDGFQFLRRLSVRGTDRAAIPVLAITGKTTADDRDEILAAGFRAYLRKPIEPAELIRAIAALAQKPA